MAHAVITPGDRGERGTWHKRRGREDGSKKEAWTQQDGAQDPAAGVTPMAVASADAQTRRPAYDAAPGSAGSNPPSPSIRACAWGEHGTGPTRGTETPLEQPPRRSCHALGLELERVGAPPRCSRRPGGRARGCRKPAARRVCSVASFIQGSKAGLCACIVRKLFEGIKIFLENLLGDFPYYERILVWLF